MRYPAAPRTDLVETLHGVPVRDPFRRLETAGDPATVAWVDAENALTRSLLDTPLRDSLVARLRDLHRVPRASIPKLGGGRIFFTEHDGTRNQAVLYMGDRVLVDPNGLDADGTTAITLFEPDEAGDRIVYGLSRHGSDRQEVLVLDVVDGRPLADRLEWVKFGSIAWWGDAFFYTRYPQPGTVPPEHEQYFCQIWLHRLGEPQAADQLVYHRPDAPEVVFEVDVTSDARHLVITSHSGASDNAEVHVIELDRDAASSFSLPGARPLVTGFSAGWHFIDGEDGRLYFRTDAGAPFGRIVRFDLDAPDPDPDPAIVVTESHDTIVDAAIGDGRLLISSLRNACGRLALWTLGGGDEREIALPGIGSLAGLAARWHDARSFATFTSFTMPPTIMVCDLEAGRLVPIRTSPLPIDPADYITEQVWYPSTDGTPISMFLVARRAGDGSAGDRDDRSAGLRACLPGSVLLTGYGGFNISLTPSFDPSDFLWLDAGGVMAVANLRGGGEYGDAWHRAGMRERKQQVFDDFIAAADWLQSTRRAAAGRVAIEGGSNGGLLVGACLVQRPDLFGAAVCRVPVADMLRYHLFTVGRFWIPEYGSADNEQDFAYLYRYSPYHNIATGVRYPPTLVMTADTDDRVAPGMAKKFAARLQEAVADLDVGPILLRVEMRAGHGAGKPIAKQIDEQADLYAFLLHYLPRTSASAQARR
jgi:prolyl oligopeptidase